MPSSYYKILENGKCIKLAPDDPQFYGFVDTGKLIVEGKNIYDSESNFIKIEGDFLLKESF